jgi:hypothetical protein
MISKSSRSHALLTLLLAGSTILPASLSGQWVPTSNRSSPTVGAWSLALPASARPVASVVSGVAALPFPTRTAPFPSPLIPQERARGRTHIAMMALGGAALVAGLMIGGDDGRIVALAGGVIGLTGLYRYMR